MSFKILLYTITIIVYNNTAINDIIVNLLFKKYIIISDVIHNGKSKNNVNKTLLIVSLILLSSV